MRVVAYCRVSTDESDQLHSLESQKRYFVEYINANIDWEFVKIYADEGITGTNVKKRKAFQEMIADAKENKFDLILTKEVSRFARNTLDSIFYTRQLMSLGIGVIFTNDNIDTRDTDAEFRLTIMASIAQEESRKTSNRVRWGLYRTMESGFVLGNDVYGYNLHNGALTINEDEAKIVRLIFSLYLQGYGRNGIAKELEKKGIPSPTGLQHWHYASILRMLQNEKYIGTLKQRKEITIDFLEHKKILNDGREPYIIIENHHDPIIDIDTFNAVQNEIKRRSKLGEDNKKYSNRYALSGKIICGQCGATFRRKYWNGKHEQKSIVWQCANNVRYGRKKPSPYNPNETIGCDCKGVHEIVLQNKFLEALQVIRDNKKIIRLELLETLKKMLENTEDLTTEIEKVQNDIKRIKFRKTRLIELFSDGAIEREDFDNSNKNYTQRMNELSLELVKLQDKNKEREDIQEKIKRFDNVIIPIVNCEEYSEEVCKSVLVRMVIHSRENISFFLSNYISPNFFIPLNNTLQVLLVLLAQQALPAPLVRAALLVLLVQQAPPVRLVRAVLLVLLVQQALPVRLVRAALLVLSVQQALQALQARAALPAQLAQQALQARLVRAVPVFPLFIWLQINPLVMAAGSV